MAAVGGASLTASGRSKVSTSSKRSTARSPKVRTTTQPALAKKTGGPEGSTTKGKKVVSTSKATSTKVKSSSTNKSDSITTKKKKKKGKHRDRSDSIDSKRNALFEYTTGVVAHPRHDSILDEGFSKQNKLLYTQTASSISDKSNLDAQTDTYSSTSDEHLQPDDIQQKFRKTFQSMKNFTAGVDELMKNQNPTVEIEGMKKIGQKPISISRMFKTKTDSPASNPKITEKIPIKFEKIPSLPPRTMDLKSDSTASQLQKVSVKSIEERLKSEGRILPQSNLQLGDKGDELPKASLEKKESDNAKKDIRRRTTTEFKPRRNMLKSFLQEEPKRIVDKKKIVVDKSSETKPVLLPKTLEVNPSERVVQKITPLLPSAVIPPSLAKMMTPSSSEEDEDSATVDLSMMRKAILETEALLAKCSSSPSGKKTGFHKTEKTAWRPKNYEKIKPRPSLNKEKAPKTK